MVRLGLLFYAYLAFEDLSSNFGYRGGVVRLFILVPIRQGRYRTIVYPLFSSVVLVFRGVFLHVRLLLGFQGLRSFTSVYLAKFFGLFLCSLFRYSKVYAVENRRGVFAKASYPVDVRPNVAMRAVQRVATVLVGRLWRLVSLVLFYDDFFPFCVVLVSVRIFIYTIGRFSRYASKGVTNRYGTYYVTR